jgi:hypothetical protein
MSKHHCLLLLAVIMFSGCSQAEISHTPISTIDLPVSPSAPPELVMKTTLQPSATSTPFTEETIIAGQPNQPPGDILKLVSLEVAPGLPSQANPPGTLLLMGYGDDRSIRLNFTQKTMLEFPESQRCFSTSPDGRWLAYCLQEEEPSSEFLVVERFDGLERVSLPLDREWEDFGKTRWIDNQQLVFILWDHTQEYSAIMPVVIVNPFTREITELVSDYPYMKSSGRGPGGINMDFVISTVIYHPSLDLVVYPKRTNDGCFVVLWDRRLQHPVVEVRDLYCFTHIPVWSPNDEQLAIALIPEGGIQSDERSRNVHEWFTISREGDVQQLTHFTDFFEGSFIESPASWSPDGQRLAFWLTTNPSLCVEEEQLAVLEVKSRQVNYYCLSGSAVISYNFPVWSPDSRYIALEAFREGKPMVVLLDIEQDWAAQIAEVQITDKLEPAGWLRNSP